MTNYFLNEKSYIGAFCKSFSFWKGNKKYFWYKFGQILLVVVMKNFT